MTPTLGGKVQRCFFVRRPGVDIESAVNQQIQTAILLEKSSREERSVAIGARMGDHAGLMLEERFDHDCFPQLGRHF